MKSLLERLNRRERLLADGAMGTSLIARGLPPGEAPERWTLDHPGIVEAVSRAYAEAGAELITTNTFGGSPLRLRQHQLDARLDEVNASAVHLARAAADGGAAVAASIGPTGQLLKPFGTVDHETMLDGYRRQVAALAAAGVDAFIIETMTAIEEAALALAAVKQEADGVPVFVTMTFDVTPRGAFTVMGVSVPIACTRLQDGGADAVGANCGTGVDAMVAIAREFAAATTLPLVFQPNAGLPMRREGRLVYPMSPEAFAREAVDLAGFANVIGGCCGTTPGHIAALRAALAI